MIVPGGERTSAPRATHSHLLIGLIFDDRGNRSSPSHVKKRDGRRYRYYVSQALLQHRGIKPGSLARVPAQAIEELVIDRLRRIASDAAAAATIEQRRELIRAWASRIEVGREQVKIAIANASEIDVHTIRSRRPHQT